LGEPDEHALCGAPKWTKAPVCGYLQGLAMGNCMRRLLGGIELCWELFRRQQGGLEGELLHAGLM
jgi:hypothetical protein